MSNEKVKHKHESYMAWESVRADAQRLLAETKRRAKKLRDAIRRCDKNIAAREPCPYVVTKANDESATRN